MVLARGRRLELFDVMKSAAEDRNPVASLMVAIVLLLLLLLLRLIRGHHGELFAHLSRRRIGQMLAWLRDSLHVELLEVLVLQLLFLLLVREDLRNRVFCHWSALHIHVLLLFICALLVSLERVDCREYDLLHMLW